MEWSWREGVRRAGRLLAAGLCAALALSIFFMALAVLVQALAVLALAVITAVLLLPHPPAWYAAQGGEAVGVFFNELLHSTGVERAPDTGKSTHTPGRDEKRSAD